ncbi:Ctr copper transporter [Apiospora aurea]|uniref:Copper transport protein n=1 Tax=Apiospora aurea TaxID=335848 RepID=A0ABR1QEC2_9PEZI
MAPHGDMADMDMSGGMDMSGMSGSSSSSSSGGMMMMMMSVFQTSQKTPLYSMAWTPQSVGGYAATCIFLIVLGTLLRGLLALKSIQESRWLDKEFKRRYVAVQGKQPMAERVSADSLAKKMTLSENGVEEDVMVVKKVQTHARPWRLSVDPVRAVIDTVIAGVGYLLYASLSLSPRHITPELTLLFYSMLAVMTMNVGYFLSVLGGVFVGSLLVGRYTITSEH